MWSTDDELNLFKILEQDEQVFDQATVCILAKRCNCSTRCGLPFSDVGMDQYLLIPFLGG